MLDFYTDGFEMLDYDFFKALLFIVTILIAPLIWVILLAMDIRGFIFLFPKRLKLLIGILQVKDKDQRKYFWLQLLNSFK
jgi:hypothetical protein